MSHARSAKRLTLLSITALLIGGTALSPSAAADGRDANEAREVLENGTVIESDGVVRYNVDLSELPGAKIASESGKMYKNGRCTFCEEGRGNAAEPGLVLVSTELSFDPGSCTREVARAEYSRDNLPESVKRKVDAQAPSSVSESGSTNPKSTKGEKRSAEVAAAATWSGSLKVNVEDPPQMM